MFDNDLMVAIALRATFLLLVTFVCAVILRNRSAALVHRIWSLGFCGSLIVPLVMFLVPNWTLPILPPQNPIALEDSVVPSHTIKATSREPSEFQKQRTQRASAAPNVVNQQPPQFLQPDDAPLGDPVRSVPSWSLGAIFFFVWFLGASLLLLRIVYHRVVMYRTLQRCGSLDCETWRMIRDSAASRLGVPQDVPLQFHPDAVAPLVAGLWKSTVILPVGTKDWPLERRKLVLLHELAHVKRRDLLMQAVAELACALYWFNPVVWWGAAQMKRLREIACDDVVVMQSNTPCDYAETLLDVAKRYRSQDQMFVVGMARGGDVEHRITAILDATRKRNSLTKRSACGIGAIALLVSVIVGVLQPTSRADEPLTQAAELEQAVQEDSTAKTVAIHVRDNETGQPLPQTKIRVRIRTLDLRRKFIESTYATDSQGRTEVVVPPRTTFVNIWTSKDDYVPLFLSVGARSPGEDFVISDKFDFKLEQGSGLSGVVVDASGKPIAKAKVNVVIVSNPVAVQENRPRIGTRLAIGEGAAVTDQDGRWRITNAPPQRSGEDFSFRLEVHHPDFVDIQTSDEMLEAQSVTTESLRDGSAALTLQRGVAISGSILGPDNQPVTEGLVLWDDETRWVARANETQMDARGRYQTRQLKPGLYPITVLAPGFAPQQKTVDVKPSLGKIDFQLRPGNPIKIKIVDRSGSVVPNAYVGIGPWRGTSALYNDEHHPNIPEAGIPRYAGDDGVYSWNWAPEDVVNYWIDAEGYDFKKVALVAQPEPYEIVLDWPIRIYGNVVDAKSGEPIQNFRVMPVTEFRPDFYATGFQAGDVAKGEKGNYTISINTHGQTENRYRVRVEAEGYRTAFGNKSLVLGEPPLKQDFALEPAAARVGIVVNPNGKPANDFNVAVGTPTNSAMFRLDRLETKYGWVYPVTGTNAFRLAATFEPSLIRVYNDYGFAERLCKPDDQIGKMKLLPWAALSGRLLQSGQPVADQWISFQTLGNRKITDARFQDSITAKTDVDGNFHFDRVPPVSGRVSAILGVHIISPLLSSKSVPLELSSGQKKIVSLGDGGTLVTGRIVATGRNNQELSKRWSSIQLVSRSEGVAFSPSPAWSFNPNGPVESAWLRQPDYFDWLETKEYYSVKLSEDGRMRIHGVAAGEYDLVIRLYENQVSFLNQIIGEKVIPVTITSDQVERGEAAMGDVLVECRDGPK